MLAHRSALLFTLLILAFSGLAHAQPENVIGLTEGQGWYQDWCVEGPGTQVYTLYIYLENPINWEFNGNSNHAVENIGGFECELSATMGATILDVRFPVPAIHVGDGNNLIVGFGEPVTVTPDQHAILAEFDVLLIPYSGDPSPGVKSSPVGCENPDGALWLDAAYPASIEGFLAYLDADDPIDPIVPAVRTDYWVDGPVMLMQTTGLPTDQATWDSVKAIYR